MSTSLTKVVSGKVLVKIRGLGEINIYRRGRTMLCFVVLAFRRLTGQEAKTGMYSMYLVDEFKEAKKWRILRSFFHKEEGVIEAERIEQ